MTGPSDPGRAGEFARRHFGPAARVEPLAGDASDRSFFRLRAPGLSSLIVMLHREPFDLERLAWFQHACFLEGIGAAVPSIVASYPAEGILVVQDLGDETLQRHLAGCDDERRRFLYLQAVQMIVFLQQEGTRALTEDLPASNTALDRERFRFELGFFVEHYVAGLLESPLGGEEASALDRWLETLARQVARYPRVLCHRDFHSRNLMVKGDRLYMVDFQDARMGPYTYDLASLIRDSYVSIPDGLARELIAFFRETARISEPPAVFDDSLARTSLQRSIKAIGTFASQAVLKGNRSYLEYIPPALASIRARLAEIGDDPQTGPILGFFEGPLDYPV